MKFEEKHRPKTLDDIIFVDAYVERIVKETAANKRHKHLILHGPRGAGKSETANLIMKSRYAEEDVNIAKCSVHASALEDKSLDILTGNWNYQRAFGMLTRMFGHRRSGSTKARHAANIARNRR